MGQRNPKVSVLMPVYNGERYVEEAVRSILGQTFVDFELLVIDDGSTDGTVAVLSRIGDERIRLVRNETNMGLPATLNRGIILAKGELIARMDDDDLALPDRLRLQVNFMDNNPEVAICGCGVEVFCEKGKARRHYFPLSHQAIRMEALFNSPVSHPGVMLRKEILVEKGYKYDPQALWVEDYDLFSRMVQSHKAVNLPYFLLRYRVSGNSVTSRADSPEQASFRKKVLAEIHRSNLARIGVQPAQQQMDLHYLLSLTARMQTIDFNKYGIREIKSYLYEITDQSIQSGYADRTSARHIAGKIYLKVILYNWRRLGFWRICMAIRSRLLWYGLCGLLMLKAAYCLKIKPR